MSESYAVSEKRELLLDKVKKFILDNGGIVKKSQLAGLGIDYRRILDFVEKGDILRVKSGYYAVHLSDFTEEELRYCINSAYDSKFDTEEIAPLVKADGAYYLELFHGSTIAFKDMALSILPYLMTTSAKKNHVENEIVILTATSGDTGKAAMAGFADVEGTRIIVFYPKDGVSRVQELQMLTQKLSLIHI